MNGRFGPIAGSRLAVKPTLPFANGFKDPERTTLAEPRRP
jgi:hypothetical protein